MKAIRHVKRTYPKGSEERKSLLSALYLAKRLKRMHKWWTVKSYKRIAREHMLRVYGKEAFYHDGKIKRSYLRKEIRKLERKEKKLKELIDSLILAKSSKSTSA